MTHTYNPNTQQPGRTEVQDHSQLHREFKANLSNMIQNKTKQKKGGGNQKLSIPRCLQQLFVVIKFGNKCTNNKKET